MLRKLIAGLAAVFAMVAVPAAAQTVKPIRVLIVSGGGYHNYANQRAILEQGLKARLNVEITHSYYDMSPGEDQTKPKLPIFTNPNYGDGFDVVIHNFKHGGAEKLGLGYEQLKAVKPDLIYCAISGYDTSGPQAARPGYDLVIQGETGLMAINGEADQPPLKFGVAIVDMMTGMYAAQAVLAALFRRERTGRGRLIEMALYDCGIMISSYYALDAMLLGRDPRRYGNAHPSIVPYGMFESADGPLVITVGNNAQFDKFCRQVLMRPDIVDDPRYATNVERGKHRVELLAMLTDLLKTYPRDLLLQRMQAAGIPCGKVLGLHEALTSEATRRGGLLREMPHPVAGTTHTFAPPYRLDGQRLPIRNAPPTLGEGTRDVLRDLLNLSDAELAALRDRGVLTLPEAPAACG